MEINQDIEIKLQFLNGAISGSRCDSIEGKYELPENSNILDRDNSLPR